MTNEWRKTKEELPELTQYVWSCDCQVLRKCHAEGTLTDETLEGF